MNLQETLARIPLFDETAARTARERQCQLTKPQGSLGRLEDLSVQLAGTTGKPRPIFSRPVVIVVAADHGVVAQGVSAFPQEVTKQMVLNFLQGGAAINVLARHIGARVAVADVGVAADLPSHPDLLAYKVARGTRDFSVGPAMTRAEALQAIEVGITLVNQEIDCGADIIGTGEMGIGNTTASSAITAVITKKAVAIVTGRGTGIEDAALARKIAVIERALEVNRPDPTDPLGVLASVGGLEIGAMAGVILGAVARRVPIVIDGFISGAAALLAYELAPVIQPHLIAAHRSVEVGHRVILDHLRLEPLFDLDLRLGEGTGATLGMSLCVAASKILTEMATFGEAEVSERV